MVSCVDHEDDPVDRAAVFTPCFSGLKMASQIVRIESDISNRNFRLVRMHSAVCLRESIALKHVQKCGLPCVIKTEEDYIG